MIIFDICWVSSPRVVVYKSELVRLNAANIFKLSNLAIFMKGQHTLVLKL